MRNKDITISPDLQKGISVLEMRALENFSPPYPEIKNLGATFYHVLEMGRDTESNSGRDVTPSYNPVEELAIGFFGGNNSLVYLILAESTKVSVHYGCTNNPEDETCLEGILKSTFPHVSLGDPVAGDSFLSDLRERPYCGLLSGIPSKKGKAGRIDRLIRGMYGEHWGYLVIAKPLIMAQIEGAIETLNLQERQFASTYLRQGTSEMSNNPSAKYYQELLNYQKARFKSGRSQGMFEVEVYVFCSSIETLDRAGVLLYSIFSGRHSKPQPLRFHQCLSTSPREGVVHTVLNTSELSLYLQSPVEEHPGFTISEKPRFKVALPYQAKDAAITIGKVLDRGLNTGNWLEIPLNNLTKHAFISGATGSGKTNTCLYLLSQLWQEHKIPWLVVEPKTEYRSLLESDFGKDVRIFTLGNEQEAPFRFNPFAVQQGVPVQSHISYLRSLFLSSFALYPPMPYVLEVAIQQIYEDKGWDTVTSKNLRGEGSRSFPTFTDLYYKVEELSGKLGYDPEVTMNVRAGLKARIQSLRVGAKGRMLDTYHSIPMEELLVKPTVLELGSIIGDPEEVAFVMGAILIALFEYRRSRGTGTGVLMHMMLLEEAHNLLSRVPETGSSSETSNIRRKAVETFCNLLAEIRAYGEGLIIVDQIPNKLAIDVIKNTNLKLIHRIVAGDDRELVGACMNMTGGQKNRLATLAVGQAVVFSENMEGPFHVDIPDVSRINSVIKDTGLSIRNHMETSFYKESGVLHKYPACKMCPLPGKCSTFLARVRSYLDGSEFGHSFDRLLLALVEKEGIINAFEELMEVVRRGTGDKEAAKTLPYAYCASLHSLEMALEVKGRLYGWSYSDIDTQACRFMEIFRSLSQSILYDDKEHTRAIIREDIEKFSKEYRALCGHKKGPFAGCKFCQEPCLYRYEVNELIRNFISLQEFYGLLQHSEGSNETIERLAITILRDTLRISPNPGCEIHADIAFCYLVQIMALAGIPPWRHEGVVRNMGTVLKKLLKEFKE